MEYVYNDKCCSIYTIEKCPEIGENFVAELSFDYLKRKNIV